MQIIIPIYNFVKSGGMRVICKLANEWAKMGNDVELVVTDDSSPYFIVSDDVRITHLNKRGYISKMHAFLKYIKKHKKIDCIIANQNLTAAFVWLAQLFYKVKGFYYIQAYEPEFYSNKNIKQIVKKVIAIISYSFPLTKIVNSDIYMDYKLVHTKKVVYPGMDLSLYYPKSISTHREIAWIGTIGRTEVHKGTSDVCRAMEILKNDGVNFEFFIAFNDFDTIPHHFVKPDGDDKLSSFYRDMDIVVAACKGQHGAIHYPVIETMAVGSTIVCTDYYPANENNSYKVDESSPEQIANAIKFILNNWNDAIKKREQELIDVQQFNWSNVAKKFIDYIQEELN